MKRTEFIEMLTKRSYNKEDEHWMIGNEGDSELLFNLGISGFYVKLAVGCVVSCCGVEYPFKQYVDIGDEKDFERYVEQIVIL